MNIPYSDLIPADYNHDEVQDSYVALLEHQPSTKGEAQSLIHRCHYRAEYHHRKRKRKAMQPLHGKVVEPDVPQTPIDPVQMALWTAISLLEKDDRELIRLRISEHYTVSALADHYKTSRATIDRRLERIIDQLKDLSQNT